jgi:hypothetical protein
LSEEVVSEVVMLGNVFAAPAPGIATRQVAQPVRETRLEEAAPRILEPLAIADEKAEQADEIGLSRSPSI